MNEIRAPDVSRPLTMRRPPTQMARTAAPSPVRKEMLLVADVAECPLQRGNGGRQSRRELAGRVAVEESDILPQEVFEGALLQLRGHAFGGEIEQAIAHERRNRLDEQQDEHQQTEDVDPVDA